jgi:hypothetical protein
VQVKRKSCNFKLPKPFVIQSSNGLKRNGYRKYIIYPDLSKFKQACLKCPHLRHKDKRYSCGLNNNEFMLKFYGIDNNLPKGVVISLGTIPLDLQAHSLAAEIRAYFSYHSQKSKKRSGLKTINKSSDDSRESSGAFPGSSKQGVGNT